METKPYTVYVKTDDEGRITAINSDAFMADTTGWAMIDSGYGDRYHHAQGLYFPQPIMDGRGICRYRLGDGEIIERTAEEMDADYVPLEQTATDGERLTAVENALTALMGGVADA